MFKKISFCLLFLFVFSDLNAQESKLQKLVKESDKNKNNPEFILRIEKEVSISKDEEQKIEAYMALAKTYKHLEVYDKPYNFYLKALKLAEKNKLINKIGLINEAMGNIQFQLGNYEKSKQLYAVSLRCFQKTNNFDEIIKIKGNLAVFDIQTGHVQRAIQTLISIQNKEKLNPDIKAATLLTLGNIYLESSKPKIAIDYYLKSLLISEQTGYKKLQIMAYQNLAETYIGLKQYDKALFYNHKSEIILQKFNSNEFKASLYFFYSEINKGKLQFKEAYENLQLQHKFKELSDRAKATLNAENIETLNKIEKQKLDLQIKEQKIKLLQNEKLAARIKIILLVLLLTGILLLLFYLIKRQRNKVKSLSDTINQTEDKLEFSLTKTDKMVLNIVKNNDFIEQFKEELKEVQTETNDSQSKVKLNKLLFDLQNFKLINDTKEDLFNEVDVEFSYKLEKKYPMLTEEERKICILVFLDLKNKDMAVILNSSVRSVENYRYRIRKKMNVAPDDTLLSVLSNL